MGCRQATVNGTKGYKVTSNKPGYTDNYIFLPASGYRNRDNIYVVGSRGHYWSSSLVTVTPYNAYELNCFSNEVKMNSAFRYYGRSVRAVSE